jgi:hypothetical protein
MLVALLFPSVVGLLAYGSAWATGLAQFVVPTGILAEVGRGMLGTASPPHAIMVLATPLAASTYGTFFSTITAAGEEIGWRGSMLTRLVEARMPHRCSSAA